MSKASGQVVTVDYATGGGTAISGVDYLPTNGIVTFNRKETSKTIVVPLVGEIDFELDETFFVTLSNPSGATITDATGEGTILNDDVKVSSLSVSMDGTGIGKITSAPAGIDCGSDCSESYPADTIVTLTASSIGESAFVGWSGGGCSGIDPCPVTMDAAKAITATFNSTATGLTLTVVKDGTGTGTVTSEPAGIDCGNDCSQSYRDVTSVTLTAVPDPGETFAGWLGGGCTFATCTITVDGAKTVKATFETGYQLRVDLFGSGPGTVTSSLAGIECGIDCTEYYPAGTTVTLAATPTGLRSGFGGWNGTACSGTGSCTVTMDEGHHVAAEFERLVKVTVTKEGDAGTVTSDPLGINCGADCWQLYEDGTDIFLTARDELPWMHVGWRVVGPSEGVECGGWGTPHTCKIDPRAATGDIDVTAIYAFRYLLTVTESGPGGTFNQPDGTYCGVDCSAYEPGTVVTVRPNAINGYVATVKWTGDCSGTDTCTVTMDQNRTVFADFGFMLTVRKDGSGSGTVTSSPVGINCGTDCDEHYAPDALVTLTASADSLSTFAGWGYSRCPGTTCTVRMDQHQSMKATFCRLGTQGLFCQP